MKNVSVMHTVIIALLIQKSFRMIRELAPCVEIIACSLCPIYTIPDHLCTGLPFMSDWGFVYTASHESDTICSRNSVQLFV